MTAIHPRNLLLAEFARVSPDAYERFLDDVEQIPLKRGAVLGQANTATEFVYFVESGVVSLVASTRSGQSLEVAVVSREGVAGIADALGQHPFPYGWVVQLPGTALRVPRRVVRDHILSCGDLHGLLMSYSQLVMHQLAQSAICNRFHTSVQRLARWLLLTAERAESQRLELTHEYLAQMVGAPRSAVTAAASALRKDGAIDYSRGVVTICSERRLRKVACECFEGLSSSRLDRGPRSSVALVVR
jgi:CRP-like cAMP-binding protein